MIETPRYRDHMTTSESAKKWTETSKNSKLKKIKELLDDSKLLNVVDARILREKLREREYKLFQHYLGLSDNKCDGKLGNMTLDYFKNYLDRLEHVRQVKMSTNLELGQLQNAVDTNNIQKNEVQYRELYETMGQDEYNRLFSRLDRLQQGQLGDCYLVSGINELARAQHFDTLIRTSFQRKKRSNGDLGYQIRIPLGEPDGYNILIKDSELSVAKIRGNDGYKFLELAYAKYKNSAFDSKHWRRITPSDLSKIEGGRTKEVLETFLGRHNISFNTYGSKKRETSLYYRLLLHPSYKKEIIGFLKNYNLNVGNKFVSLSSLPGKSDRNSYTVGGKTMYNSHAYSLAGVIKDNKGNIEYVKVLNPWNSSGSGNNYLHFTLDEFLKAFSYISCGTIKTKTFLDNKGKPGPFDFLSIF